VKAGTLHSKSCVKTCKLICMTVSLFKDDKGYDGNVVLNLNDLRRLSLKSFFCIVIASSKL